MLLEGGIILFKVKKDTGVLILYKQQHISKKSNSRNSTQLPNLKWKSTMSPWNISQNNEVTVYFLNFVYINRSGRSNN